MVANFSILIPVYNFNVVPLVEQLNKLALQTELPYEILIIDDHSTQETKKTNATVRSFEKLNYIELAENIGRAKIRNLLFEKAKYDSCIILDCDVLLAKENFLELYLDHLTEANVVVGGHIYLPKPPKDKAKYFHWLYGRRIEVKPLKQRVQNTYESFMTNSFAISKSLFSKIKFEESLTQYGHEDTLFGIQLKKQNIKIVHVFNPVVHLGLENEDEFLLKQEKAIENLVSILKKSEYRDEIAENVRLIKFYNLFYNKFPYSLILIVLNGTINFLSKFMKFDFIKLTKFNLWKLKTFDFYFKKMN